MSNDYCTFIKRIYAVYKDTEVGKVGVKMSNKKKKKKESDVLLTFLGGSADAVTGSMQLIEIKQRDGSYKGILLECGAIQTTSNILGKDLSANRKMLDKLPKEVVSNIEYVLLSHAHC